MKVIGVVALVVGLALFTIWVGTWIAIASERGMTEAVRLGYNVWPGNVAQLGLGALSLLFSGGGLALVIRKNGSY